MNAKYNRHKSQICVHVKIRLAYKCAKILITIPLANMFQIFDCVISKIGTA